MTDMSNHAQIVVPTIQPTYFKIKKTGHDPVALLVKTWLIVARPGEDIKNGLYRALHR